MEFICVSEIFFFVCFVVVLVGGGSNYSAALGKPYSEVGIYAVDALLVLNVIIERFAEDATYDCQHSRVKMGVSMSGVAALRVHCCWQCGHCQSHSRLHHAS